VARKSARISTVLYGLECLAAAASLNSTTISQGDHAGVFPHGCACKKSGRIIIAETRRSGDCREDAKGPASASPRFRDENKA
jgi:hypothetical protein